MFLLSTLLILTPLQQADTLKSYDMPVITISAPLKHNRNYRQQPIAATSINLGSTEAPLITEPKNLSLRVPNMLNADYGSKMTSSIYIRGIGSRMDQPSMGLYVDNIPVMNKNNYDFDYFDLSSIDVLRGPQGTLYGRNTIGGVMDIHTLSPADYQGTRIKAGYGNGNTSSLNISTYHKPTDAFAFSIALKHHYSDGFFTNTYDDSAADRILSESGRVKIYAALSDRLTMESILSANYVTQQGFAYSLYDEQTGIAAPIDHNDPCAYSRVNLSEGLIFRYKLDNIDLSSTTSYQYTDDEMLLDQDFLRVSMFTLRQAQRENAVTQDFVARSTGNHAWQWTTGLSGFYRHIDMDAPVTFKQDGIDELILANANAGIHTQFPDADLLIRETQFPIESRFRLPAYGASLYHQSTFTTGRWKFTAGLRLDYEHTAIRYSNEAVINYRFTLTMPDYKTLPVKMSGRQDKSFFEVMPKAAVMYETNIGKLYATATRGYKAGGFNTQIFSDIIQNRMMTDLMADLGIYFGDNATGYDPESAIYYKPEYSWNYELGGHFKLLNNKLLIDAALFYIDCRNQQLTVFPPGKTTGRLMSNAGRTRSAGAELTIGYRAGGFLFSGSYGYTNAKFIEYKSGDNDYAGNYVPYAPQNTISLGCEYDWRVRLKWLDKISFSVNWQGAGRIYWNEDNSVSQPFYGLLNASATFVKGNYSLGVWAKNITNESYNTFYFKSIGNSFVQRGKPLQIGFFINLTI